MPANERQNVNQRGWIDFGGDGDGDGDCEPQVVQLVRGATPSRTAHLFINEGFAPLPAVDPDGPLIVAGWQGGYTRNNLSSANPVTGLIGLGPQSQAIRLQVCVGLVKSSSGGGSASLAIVRNDGLVIRRMPTSIGGGAANMRSTTTFTGYDPAPDPAGSTYRLEASASSTGVEVAGADFEATEEPVGYPQIEAKYLCALPSCPTLFGIGVENLDTAQFFFLPQGAVPLPIGTNVGGGMVFGAPIVLAEWTFALVNAVPLAPFSLAATPEGFGVGTGYVQTAGEVRMTAVRNADPTCAYDVPLTFGS